MSTVTTTAKDDPVLIALRADLTARKQEAKQILADPNPTEERVKRAEAIPGEIGDLQSKIDARHQAIKSLGNLEAQLQSSDDWASQPADGTLPFNGEDGRKTADVQGQTKDGRKFRLDHVMSPEDRLKMTGGFKSLMHFGHCVWKQGRDGRGDPGAVKALNDWDALQRKMVRWELEHKSPSGMFEMSDPDGGLLVPPQYSNYIYERMVATNDLLARLDPIQATSNVIRLRALAEDSRVDGSRGGGILGYWEGEADQYTKSKTKFRPIELNLHKLTVFTFVTEELMQDANISTDAYIGNLAAKEINFKLNDAIINGTGQGMPLGILNSNSLITVTAVSGQGANTIVAANILAMRSRVIAGQRGSLVWLYGQDAEPQLFSMFQSTGTAAGVLFFTPNQDGDLNFFGKPALVIEQAKTLGTAGDIIAFATDGYVCATKGGLQSFMSIHLRFDYDEVAFKWRFRFDGQPWDDKPMTLANNSTTVSSIVVLNSTRT